MPLLTGLASSLTSTRLPATSCTPSTTRRPPAAGLSGAPVEAARTGGNEPVVSSVLPVMELMAIYNSDMCLGLSFAGSVGDLHAIPIIHIDQAAGQCRRAFLPSPLS